MHVMNSLMHVTHIKITFEVCATSYLKNVNSSLAFFKGFFLMIIGILCGTLVIQHTLCVSKDLIKINFHRLRPFLNYNTKINMGMLFPSKFGEFGSFV
jgi:hypothetical protein